ncbi:Formin [Liparis tanakae]|uniref:Formin n=1 Tax=Liparis tanakae TaxID=230148 RepID=A0A4Z2H474_9TELE|nr:Formin [Liparis tanakae]
MEEPKAILTFFRTLSEEEDEDLTQGGPGLSRNLNKNRHVSFEDAVENSRDSLSGTLFPHLGEEIVSKPEGDVRKREAGNDSDVAEEERNNNDNLTEPRSHETWLDERTPKESHGHSSSDCTDTGSGFTQDDAQEAHHRGRQEDFVTRASSFHPEESGNSTSSKTKHVIIMVTRTRSEEEEEEEEEVEPLAAASLEQAAGPSCFQNIDEDERTAEDSEEEEEGDASPDVSAQRSLLPKDAAPNIIAASAVNNLQHGSTCTRGTFLPGPPADKQNQIPAFFRGLRVLKKGAVGPEHDSVAQIKASSQEPRGEISPERQGDAKAQGRLLGHISQFLTRKKSVDEKEEMIEMEGKGDQDEDEDEEDQIEESEMGERQELETEEDAEVSSESPKPSVSSAEAAFDAFKAFFTPKPLKKDPTEKVDLDAVRRKIRADKETLRALFERRSGVTPEKRKSSDGKVRVACE